MLKADFPLVPVLVAAIALLVGAACSDPTDALTYENRRAFSPPMETYSRWWAQLEKCSERSRDLAGIRWFLADDIGGPRGQWISNREITLLTGYEDEFRVVKHEMLHDLLRGDGDHSHEAWQTCVDVDRMPGDPLIPTGTYEYELFRTMGTTEWRFEGTLTITSVTEEEVEGTWDVVSVIGSADSRYAEGVVSGRWDYDAYAVGARVVGDPGWEIENRIARVDGKVRCRIAMIGGDPVACIVRGPN